jgi:hypothetical protein
MGDEMRLAVYTDQWKKDLLDSDYSEEAVNILFTVLHEDYYDSDLLVLSDKGRKVKVSKDHLFIIEDPLIFSSENADIYLQKKDGSYLVIRKWYEPEIASHGLEIKKIGELNVLFQAHGVFEANEWDKFAKEKGL